MTVIDGCGDNRSALRNRGARCEKGIACSGGDCPWRCGSGIHHDRISVVDGLRITGCSVSYQATNGVAVRTDRVTVEGVQGIAAGDDHTGVTKLDVAFELTFALPADGQLVVLARSPDAMECPRFSDRSRWV